MQPASLLINKRLVGVRNVCHLHQTYCTYSTVCTVEIHIHLSAIKVKHTCTHTHTDTHTHTHTHTHTRTQTHTLLPHLLLQFQPAPVALPLCFPFPVSAASSSSSPYSLPAFPAETAPPQPSPLESGAPGVHWAVAGRGAGGASAGPCTCSLCCSPTRSTGRYSSLSRNEVFTTMRKLVLVFLV